MTVQSVNTQTTPNTVTVQQLAAIPFELSDDDATPHPFNVDTALMQYSDNQNQNLFAPAYIRPVYDLGTGAKQAGFNLNVEDTGNELNNQLSAGRDFTSSDEFWVVYLQGAFQGPIVMDSDPSAEATTSPGVRAGVTLGLRYDGSLIFVEGNRDVERIAGLTPGTCLRTTVVHEAGHQFGLDHPEGGIMATGCPKPNIRFEPISLDKLRGVPHPLR